MNEHQIALVMEFVRTGGLVVGIILGIVLAYLILKYVVPVLSSLKPTNGDKHGGGATFMLLQEAAKIPGALNSLTDEFKVMKDYIFTKDEVIREMEKNRHDVANKLIEPLTQLTDVVKQALEPADRRRRARRKTYRRAR